LRLLKTLHVRDRKGILIENPKEDGRSIHMRDFTGKDAGGLRAKRLFLFDMDGTIYEGGRLFAGVKEMLTDIRARGGRYMFITNNSSRSVSAYQEKLSGMGIEAGGEDFFTSAQATALYLNREYPGKKVYCMGTRSLTEELKKAGVAVVGMEEEDPDVVLVGYDTELTYEKVSHATRMLLKGLPYIATNPDRVCPIEFGFVPDCAAMCEMLAFAVHRYPKYIGKPEPDMIWKAMERAGASREETIVIGDRLYTDIASGVNAGVSTVCVLCGESSWQDVEESPVKPEYVFEDIADFAAAIRGRGAC
jgi:4-nitrophenyl phosphatase